jgi:rare lipoprotein A
VINLNNGRTVIVVIVDRGPFISGRIIDVSMPTADALGFRQAGVARVKIEVGDR